MKILVINTGSSSIKYQFFEMYQDQVLVVPTNEELKIAQETKGVIDSRQSENV